MLSHILFDLDNTLYPRDSGLWEAIGRRIRRYMIERVGISPDTAGPTRDRYLREFGTTLNALMHYHDVDAGNFLEFVHDLPLGEYLAPAPELDGMLSRLPLRKVIFSNADHPHVRRVLSTLGIERHFERIIDIYALEFVNKPDQRAYHKALNFLAAAPEQCLFIEDAPENLEPASRLGMTTVLIGSSRIVSCADHRIDRITELEGFVNRLLGNP